MRGGWSARYALTTLLTVSASTVCARAYAACGDGTIDGAETCDDRNQVDGDGCTASCQFEAGYVCTGAPSVCCFADATAAYTLLANATYSASEAAITLTPDDIWKEGTAWYRLPLDFNNPFTLSLRIYLGTRDDAPMSNAVDTGADGGSILFQRDPRGLAAKGMYTGAAGQDGRELGAKGITPVVGVEFDTYNNGVMYGDTIAQGDEDHTSVFQSRVTNQLAPARCMNDGTSCSNFEDGQWHRFDITWSGDLDHHLGVWIDGKQRVDLGTDLVGSYFADDPLGITFGLSASTGGERNLQRFCPLAPLGFAVPRDADTDGIDDSVDTDDDGDSVSDRDETAGVFGSDDPGGDHDPTPDSVPNYRDADYWRDVLMRAGDCVDLLAPIGACDSLITAIDGDGDGIPNHLDLVVNEPAPPDAGTGAPIPPADASVQDAAAPVPGVDASVPPMGSDASAPPASNPCLPDKNALACAPGDADGDGLSNALECPGLASCRDSDGDGVSDYADADSDGDGIPDKTECPDMNACADLDGDAIPDYLSPAPVKKDDGCALAGTRSPSGALWLLLLMLSARTGWCARSARARACGARRSLPWSRAARRRPPAAPQSR